MRADKGVMCFKANLTVTRTTGAPALTLLLECSAQLAAKMSEFRILFEYYDVSTGCS